MNMIKQIATTIHIDSERHCSIYCPHLVEHVEKFKYPGLMWECRMFGVILNTSLKRMAGKKPVKSKPVRCAGCVRFIRRMLA